MKSKHSTLLAILILAALTATFSCSSTKRARLERAQRLYDEANQALHEKRYTDAITAYDQVLKVVPGEIGVLSNKSAALRGRGTTTYNSAVKITDDPALRESRIAAGKQDMASAADVSATAAKTARESIALNLLHALSGDELRHQVLCNHAETMRVVATAVDTNRTEEAVAAIYECVELESDSEKETVWRLAANNLLLKSGKTDQALAGYKELLSKNPDSIEAMLGVGLALSQSGDSRQFEEAKPYLKKFVERAPDGHPMKADVIQTLSYMK